MDFESIFQIKYDKRKKASDTTDNFSRSQSAPRRDLTASKCLNKLIKRRKVRF